MSDLSGLKILFLVTEDWYFYSHRLPVARAARDAGSLPFVATIPPVNVGAGEDAPPERNDWVAAMNDLVRVMAAQEGAVLVGVHQAYLSHPDPLLRSHAAWALGRLGGSTAAAALRAAVEAESDDEVAREIGDALSTLR